MELYFAVGFGIGFGFLIAGWLLDLTDKYGWFTAIVSSAICGIFWPVLMALIILTIARVEILKQCQTIEKEGD